MKSFVRLPFLLALCASAILGIAISAGAQKNDTALTFNAEVLRSGCVPHKTLNADAKACIESSARSHEKLVLYDPSTNITFRIADQSKAAQFAGQDVTVSGYVDGSSRAFDIAEITPVS